MTVSSGKGIILAGGEGTRLYPLTRIATKQLLPIYDKPMIYYPLSVLMLMGVRDILMICKPEDQTLFERVLGDGSHLGLRIDYKIQLKPRGLPEAFVLGRDFIGNDPVTLLLGDNIFYGSGLIPYIKDCLSTHDGASTFTFYVNDPERFGVVNYNKDGSVKSMEEKPKNPKSSWAMAGFYHLDADAVERAADLKPSARGETEMVELLGSYHKEKRLQAFRMARGFAWLDTGTPEAMMEAGKYVQILEDRQGIKIACLEEIAYHKDYITAKQLKALADPIAKTTYGQYLLRVLES
jgi:glucose-1-phosphate thymidylyltransferase